MEKRYILSLDQGTTSSRAILFDVNGAVVKQSQKAIEASYPEPGWVEQDPMEIWGSQSGVAREVLETAGVSPFEVAAFGIANQRETTIVWNRHTGRPVYRAIVWQCRRTAAMCEALKAAGHSALIAERTGLLIDAYFSATKLAWILEHVEGAREAASKGDLLFGTVDTWIIWNLTRGRVHATDVSNASRTMMFNIHTQTWDADILALLNIPVSMLPVVCDTSGIFGHTDAQTFGGANIPIASAVGDQQAALFGHGCFEKGSMKNTYGTGCFMLMHTGGAPVKSKNGLLTTIGWRYNGETAYALEGAVFVAGAVIQWLRDDMEIIDRASESEALARSVPDTGGVYLVPAFTGLGAPYWDMYARGTLVGITRDTRKQHVVRAALESMAYQTKDVVGAMMEDSGLKMKALKVDGGASANGFLMQFQADILGCEVLRPDVTEITALGAAYLAGLAVGFWPSEAALPLSRRTVDAFQPEMDMEDAARRYRIWQKAVMRSKDWAE